MSTQRTNISSELQANPQGYFINVATSRSWAKPEKKRKDFSVNSSTMMLFCVALVLLFILFYGGPKQESVVRQDIPVLLKEYAAYLVQNKSQIRVDLRQRLGEVRRQLQNAAELEEKKEYDKAKQSLIELMFFDGDVRSPLYQRCARWLKNIPNK